MTTRSLSMLILLLLPLAAAADEHECEHRCRRVDGPFTSTLTPPPACTSPLGLCTHGILEGDLDATYDFTFETLMPAGDPLHPGRFFYTGYSVITPDAGARHGQLFSNDHGVLDMSPDPLGLSAFVTTVDIVRGTRRFHEVGGTLVASGLISFATGDASGSYSGELCRRDDDDDDR